jgi:hypothetical protein
MRQRFFGNRIVWVSGIASEGCTEEIEILEILLNSIVREMYSKRRDRGWRMYWSTSGTLVQPIDLSMRGELGE